MNSQNIPCLVYSLNNQLYHTGLTPTVPKSQLILGG